jgi:hypothetical protein
VPVSAAEIKIHLLTRQPAVTVAYVYLGSPTGV